MPGGQQGAAEDPDHDGSINLMEYTIAGLTYVIETSPNLQQPWMQQVTQTPGNTDTAIS